MALCGPIVRTIVVDERLRAGAATWRGEVHCPFAKFLERRQVMSEFPQVVDTSDLLHTLTVRKRNQRSALQCCRPSRAGGDDGGEKLRMGVAQR